MLIIQDISVIILGVNVNTSIYYIYEKSLRAEYLLRKEVQAVFIWVILMNRMNKDGK